MSITKMRKSFASGKLLKWIMGGFSFLFVVSCFTFYNSYTMGGRRNNGDNQTGNVVTVNGQPISYQEFQNALQQSEKQQEAMMGGQKPSSTQRAYMQSQTLDQLIDQRLKLQAAKKEGLEVSNKAIDKEVDKIVKQQVDMLRSQIIGDKKGKKVTDDDLNRELRRLHSQNDRIPQSVGALRDQLNSREVRNEIEASLLVQALDKKVEGSVKNLTDAALTESYTKVRAQHILIKVGEGGRPDAQAKRRAEEVLKKVKAGEDFGKLAKEYSDDPGSKAKDGDLGFFSRGMLVPEFDKVAFSLKPGQVSGLVKTQFGYHIIKVNDSKVDLPKDFAKNKAKYREQVLATKRNKAKTEYYANLRKSAKIEINDPFLRGMDYMKQAYTDPTQTAKYQNMAEKSFEKAAKDHPNDASTYIMLTNLYTQTNQKEKARKLLEEVLDVKSSAEDADLRMQLGNLYKEKNENEKAIKQYQIASDVGYDDPNIHFQLQGIYKELNRPDLAAEQKKYVDDYLDRMRAQQAAMQPKPAETEKPAKSDKTAKPEKTKSGG